MQQNQKTIYEKLVNAFIGITWISGLLIAGSDSDYMPWLNGIGLVLFFGASLLSGKFLAPSRAKVGKKPVPGCPPNRNPRVQDKKIQGLDTRYALEA